MRQANRTPSPKEQERIATQQAFISDLQALEERHGLMIDTADAEGITLITRTDWLARRQENNNDNEDTI